MCCFSEGFSEESIWSIPFDGLSSYLCSFQKESAANFFQNDKCCLPDKKNVRHLTKEFTKIGLNQFIKYLLRPIVL